MGCLKLVYKVGSPTESEAEWLNYEPAHLASAEHQIFSLVEGLTLFLFKDNISQEIIFSDSNNRNCNRDQYYV